MKTNIPFLLLSIFLFSCTQDEINIPVYEAKIVVDGWIEEGEVARVILTYSSPYFSEIDSFNIFDFVDARAKIIVSDGETEEVLTLRKDNSHFPPFVYTGQEIKGKAGRTYTMKIDQPPYFLTAHSKLPESPHIDQAWFEYRAEGDTLGTPFIKINDDPDKHNYYRVLTKRFGVDKRFIPSLVPNFSDAIFSDNLIEYQVFKSSEFEIIKDEEIHFKKGDSILVKVLSMDEPLFEYWNTFYNEQFNSGNPFADSKIRLKGNIEGGGIGIWAAYGKKTVGVKAQ